jgi:hypothetical protein
MRGGYNIPEQNLLIRFRLTLVEAERIELGLDASTTRQEEDYQEMRPSCSGLKSVTHYVIPLPI